MRRVRLVRCAVTLAVDDFLVLEKGTGHVKRVRGGETSVVLDLPVNSNSERGMRFRAFQQDEGQPVRRNHDVAHLTGVIVRLEDDGSAPRDNPLFETGRAMGGEVGANLQRLFAYGIRNGFGLALDPESGDLWEQENGDDSFSEAEPHLFMGGSRNFLEGGRLLRIELEPGRRAVAVSDLRLEDRVADKLDTREITESESLLFGRNFGIGTDIQTSPDGTLYVVSNSRGSVYEIFRPDRRGG